MHYKNNKQKTLGSQAAHLVATLYEQNKPIFRLKEVQKILRVDEVSSRNFVRKLVNRRVVTRLKPGLFILVPFSSQMTSISEFGQVYRAVQREFRQAGLLKQRKI